MMSSVSRAIRSARLSSAVAGRPAAMSVADLRATSYDACLLASRAVLGLHGFPRLAYASHQPQVVDKELLAEVVALLAPAATRHPLDEWATYFNVAPSSLLVAPLG